MTAESASRGRLDRLTTTLVNQTPAHERRAFGAALLGLATMCRLSAERWETLADGARVDFRTDLVPGWVRQAAAEIEADNPQLLGVLSELTAAARPSQLATLVNWIEGETAAVRVSDSGTFADWVSTTTEASAAVTKGQGLTPAPLAQLMVDLAFEGAPGPTFDPYCRSGELLDRATREVTARGAATPCVGFAPHALDAALARLRLYLLGADAEIHHGDALREPLVAEGRLRQFERIVCDPPWGRLGSLDLSPGAPWLWIARDGRSVSSEAAYLRLAQTMLGRDGRAVIRIPLGLLFRGGADRSLRRALLAEDLVSMVVGLPTGLVPGAAMQSALIVLDRGGRGRADQRVLMADLSPTRADRASWAREALASLRDVAYGARPVGRWVTHDEIAAKDFDLSPRAYLVSPDDADAPLADARVLDEARALEREAADLAEEIDRRIAAWQARRSGA